VLPWGLLLLEEIYFSVLLSCLQQVSPVHLVDMAIFLMCSSEDQVKFKLERACR